MKSWRLFTNVSQDSASLWDGFPGRAAKDASHQVTDTSECNALFKQESDIFIAACARTQGVIREMRMRSPLNVCSASLHRGQA